jgi:hypothetical protein
MVQLMEMVNAEDRQSKIRQRHRTQAIRPANGFWEGDQFPPASIGQSVEHIRHLKSGQKKLFIIENKPKEKKVKDSKKKPSKKKKKRGTNYGKKT